MTTKPMLWLPVAATLMAPGSARADDTEQELAPVVVEDRRTALPAPATPAYERTAVPASVAAEQEFSHEDIQAMRPRDIFDLMEGSLGMSVSRQGSRVNNFSSNRGGNVGFILDGVYLTATEAQRVVGDIPVDMIASIKFIRDSSVLGILPVMGFGARVSTPSQGVVVIDTLRRDGGADSTNLKGSYASYETWKGNGNFRRSWQDGRLQLGGGYQHAESAGKPDWNNAYAADTYMLNGGWKDSDFMAMASFYANRGEREIQRYIGVVEGASVPVGTLNSAIWKYDPRDSQVFSLNLAWYWNGRHTTALTYGETQVDGTGWFYSTTTDPSTVAGRDFKDQSDDLNLSHTVTGTQNTFKAGAQRIGYYQLSESATTPREEAIYGIYLADEYRITPAWSVDASARVDKKHVSQGGDKYGADGSTIQLSDDTWTDRADLISVGSAWQIDPVWRVSGRYAYSRTPTPDTITTAGDTELPAERLSRWELGLDAKLDPALQVSLTPFYYVARDAKVVDSTVPGIDVYNPDTGSYETLSVYTSADKVTRKGFELGLKGRFAGDALGYELGWSHFSDDSVNADSGGVETPKNRYSARLNWYHGPWTSNLSVLRVDPYCHYFKGACLATGDFTVVNLNVSRTFSHGVTVSVFGQNLLDEHYYTRHKTGNGSTIYTLSDGAIADVGATYGVELEVAL